MKEVNMYSQVPSNERLRWIPEHQELSMGSCSPSRNPQLILLVQSVVLNSMYFY